MDSEKTTTLQGPDDGVVCTFEDVPALINMNRIVELEVSTFDMSTVESSTSFLSILCRMPHLSALMLHNTNASFTRSMQCQYKWPSHLVLPNHLTCVTVANHIYDSYLPLIIALLQSGVLRVLLLPDTYLLTGEQRLLPHGKQLQFLRARASPGHTWPFQAHRLPSLAGLQLDCVDIQPDEKEWSAIAESALLLTMLHWTLRNVRPHATVFSNTFRTVHNWSVLTHLEVSWDGAFHTSDDTWQLMKALQPYHQIQTLLIADCWRPSVDVSLNRVETLSIHAIRNTDLNRELKIDIQEWSVFLKLYPSVRHINIRPNVYDITLKKIRKGLDTTPILSTVVCAQQRYGHVFTEERKTAPLSKMDTTDDTPASAPPEKGPIIDTVELEQTLFLEEESYKQEREKWWTSMVATVDFPTTALKKMYQHTKSNEDEPTASMILNAMQYVIFGVIPTSNQVTISETVERFSYEVKPVKPYPRPLALQLRMPASRDRLDRKDEKRIIRLKQSVEVVWEDASVCVIRQHRNPSDFMLFVREWVALNHLQKSGLTAKLISDRCWLNQHSSCLATERILPSDSIPMNRIHMTTLTTDAQKAVVIGLSQSLQCLHSAGWYHGSLSKPGRMFVNLRTMEFKFVGFEYATFESKDMCGDASDDFCYRTGRMYDIACAARMIDIDQLDLFLQHIMKDDTSSHRRLVREFAIAPEAVIKDRMPWVLKQAARYYEAVLPYVTALPIWTDRIRLDREIATYVSDRKRVMLEFRRVALCSAPVDDLAHTVTRVRREDYKRLNNETRLDQVNRLRSCFWSRSFVYIYYEDMAYPDVANKRHPRFNDWPNYITSVCTGYPCVSLHQRRYYSRNSCMVHEYDLYDLKSEHVNGKRTAMGYYKAHVNALERLGGIECGFTTFMGTRRYQREHTELATHIPATCIPLHDALQPFVVPDKTSTAFTSWFEQSMAYCIIHQLKWMHHKCGLVHGHLKSSDVLFSFNEGRVIIQNFDYTVTAADEEASRRPYLKHLAPGATVWTGAELDYMEIASELYRFQFHGATTILLDSAFLFSALRTPDYKKRVEAEHLVMNPSLLQTVRQEWSHMVYQYLERK